MILLRSLRWFVSQCLLVIISADLEQTHGVKMLSFVDNWSFQTSSPLRAVQAAEHVTTVTGQISMVMAMNKMKFYSTHAAHRKELKHMAVCNHPVTVVHDLKDLGVFFSAVAKQSAKT